MKEFSRAVFVVLAAAGSSVLHAQTIDRPVVSEGDKWVYSVRVDESKSGVLTSTTRKHEAWVTRVASHSFIMARKPADSNLPPQEVSLNPDWSTSRNINGKNTVVTMPYDFPLKTGKTWDTDTTDQHPNPTVKTLRNTLHYTVLGWEEIKVPAGTFKALKIETEGDWFKEYAPRGASANSTMQNGPDGTSVAMNSRPAATPPSAGGRMYKVLWYAPEVKREVKMIAEDYDPNGVVQHRTTAELESFSTR
jgi:hypothetical protein